MGATVDVTPKKAAGSESQGYHFPLKKQVLDLNPGDPFWPGIVSAILPDPSRYLPEGWTEKRWNQALHEHHVGNACDGEF